jgi:DNA-damage-inducible protein D
MAIGIRIRYVPHWNLEKEIWYFSVKNGIEILTNRSNPRDDWFKIKRRIKTEDGIELSTIYRELK